MIGQLRQIARHFNIPGEVAAAEQIKTGHIHDSYLLTLARPEHRTRYLLQRINHVVFHNPAQLMDNIQRVSEHIAGKTRAGGAAGIKCTLTVECTNCGENLHYDGSAYWRLYHYIENAASYETSTSPAIIYQAAQAYGQFQKELLDLPADTLHETIADFHHTPRRYEALRRARVNDVQQRAGMVQTEISFALAQQGAAGAICNMLHEHVLPVRVVHNDAKLSNVLFDKAGRGVLCVVDFDTVMPGTVLYDFGDMMRSMTCAASEDETDVASLECRLPLFEALVQGYLDVTADFIEPSEREHLLLGGLIISLEQGVRFLTDFLEGDRYYRTAHPLHNLLRCRAQFGLVKAIMQQEDALHEIIRRA